MRHVTLDTIEGDADALELDDLLAEEAEEVARRRADEAVSMPVWRSL